MSKYIDADKLIANLERQNTDKKVIEPLIRIITSLQQEQQDNEDIDKVAQELYEHLYELKRRNRVPTNLYDKQEIISLWKAGIEYGRNHPKQDQPEVDLNDEIKKFIEEYGYERGEDKLLIAIVARHFFEFGKLSNKK